MGGRRACHTQEPACGPPPPRVLPAIGEGWAEAPAGSRKHKRAAAAPDTPGLRRFVGLGDGGDPAAPTGGRFGGPVQRTEHEDIQNFEKKISENIMAI